MTTFRHISAKRAWAEMSERARLGHALGFIDAIGLLFSQGLISRAQVIELFRSRDITKADLIAYRKTRGVQCLDAIAS